MTHDFDLITLGAGSGGVAASRRAASHGARVAVVESSRVGGTCVIRGCVPKKLLMYAAAYRNGMEEAEGYGWQLPSPPRFEMGRWAAAKAGELDRLEGIYRQMLAGAGVELFEGHGRIVGPNTVAVGDRRITAKHILIATGAAPVRDSLPGIELCATSDDLLDLTALPERAAVIGAGYIGLEFASMLSRLGVQVSLYFRDRLPLRGFDGDLRTRLAAALQAAGVEMHPGMAPQRIQRAGDAFLMSFADDRVREAPFVLNATGRSPNTADLGLDSVGVQVNEAGAVKVDDQLRTTAAGVFAVGDVTDRLNLTPVAIAEGRAWADSFFSPLARSIDLSLVASAVFTLPPVASIGLTEDDALQARQPVKVFEADFRSMRQAFIGGAERCYMKLLVDAASDRVLGVHMLGADAPEIIQGLAVALTAGASKAHFDRTMAIHPTTAEEFVLMREPTRVTG